MGRKKFELPSLIVGPADVSRVHMELEQLEEYLHQAKLKKVEAKLPRTSRTLDSLAEINDADLLKEADRQHLVAFIESLQQHAPVLHISFASEPSAAFTTKIVEWLRANISSFVLVQIGLQPSIAAGCVVRTSNKVFDLSLGRFLRAKRHLLTEALRPERTEASVKKTNIVSGTAA
jgi:F0F1-type ATP synthase delta subunit